MRRITFAQYMIVLCGALTVILVAGLGVGWLAFG